MNEIDWSNCVSTEGANHYTQSFLACTQGCFLHQHVLEPTRFRHGEAPSVLDLVFSNEEAMVHDLTYLVPLGASDHSCLGFCVQVSVDATPPSATHLNVGRGDYDKFKNMLDEVNWDMHANSGDVETFWRNMMVELDSAITDCIPKKAKMPPKNLFMNRETIHLRRRKNKLYAKYLRTGDHEAYARFAILRNRLRKKTRQIRYDHEENLGYCSRHQTPCASLSTCHWRLP
ncbi:hypothetical protein Pcinc_038510 [Petrolisthes cinctipes]|uniref:Endonuclease/exonuclease/phosphatase domain-containing protein n=1 Tax=Petrolisthes cinctipes TaxID=88211 RepID=A0AAE1BRP5_PETCI|nr:hypothetical protein Pcinc_038510 [Petrolisthes cinctipes]